MKLYLLLPIFTLIFCCTSGSQPTVTPELSQSNKTRIHNCDYTTIYDTIIHIEYDKILNIIIGQDCYANLLISILDEQKFLYSAAGHGNSILINPKNPIKKVYFRNSKEYDLVINSYIDGSTYGAENLFIISPINRFASIYCLNLSGATIEDVDNDGISEIKSYDGEQEHIYRFDVSNDFKDSVLKEIKGK